MPSVEIVPCGRDNYAFVVHAGDPTDVLIVDASEPAPVLAALERLKTRRVTILCTHHHHDHVGGNGAVANRYPGTEVYAHASESVPRRTRTVAHGDEIDAASLRVRVLSTPGHTLGSVCYRIDDALFTGDTLFGAGCGRLFEGTAAMLYDSLYDRIGKLPDATQIYFGHEYTEDDLRFAAHVEPGNQAVKDRLARVRSSRAPTVPSTLGLERATNPFLRVDAPEIVACAATRLTTDRSPVAVLGAIRAMKDAW
jgi:hydroxyacylglutathione hydrolase